MDYETKIYLDKLIEAINRPDWWTIGITSAITVINAAIMAWIAWNQYKLQQQQLKLQEQQNAIQGYEMHKLMYQFVMETNAYVHYLLPRICRYLQEHNPYEDIAPLIKMKEDIDEMSKDFNDKFVDINIQLSFLEAFDYDNLLYDMRRIVEKLEDIINEGGIKADYKVEELIITTDDSVYINGILGYIKDEFVDEYRVVLEEFVENKDYVTKCLNSYIEGKVKNISF